nr:MAG: DNA pilot protein [Microvirus sp.]QJB19636.1 MAG: DNA pilot protein [Microvirus sp.]
MGLFSGITDFLKPITGAVGDIMGIAAPFMEQQSISDANRMNQQIASQQMDFQAGQSELAYQRNRTMAELSHGWNKDMATDAYLRNAHLSNTSYRRAVADLKAAGLNPMLAYSQGGASSPGSPAGSAGPGGSNAGASGATAVMQPTFRAQSVASAAAAQQAVAQVNNVKADTRNKEALTDQIKAETRLKYLLGDTEGYRPGLVSNQAAESSDRARQIRDMLKPAIDKLRADTDSSRATADQIRSQNMAVKMLMDNPDTAPIAAIIQLLVGRR